MSESRLELVIDSRAAERSLNRLEGDLHDVDRAGSKAASSADNLGMEIDRMRSMAIRASGVLSGSAAAIGLMARQSSDAAREIKNLSRLAGTDVVAFQKMTMASRQFGIEQEQLAQIILDTQDRIGDFLQTGQGELADFFENIAGKSNLTAEALAKMAGPDALQAIYNALENANLSASETVFYLESLASDATRLIPLLKDNGAGFREVANEADRLGVALSEIEIDKLTSLRNEFADLESVVASSTAQIIAEYSDEISATVDGLGDSISLLADNFDTLTNVASLAAGVMTTRFVGAMAAGTASIVSKTAASIADARAEAASTAAVVRRTAAEKQTALALLSTTRLEVQATKGTAAHTFALQQLSVARTRAATAAGAHTAAMNTATAATARASVAARGLSGALALVGGPLGLLVGAGGLMYMFREELGLVRRAAEPTTQRIDNLTDAINRNSVAAVEAGIVNLAAEYFTLGQRAASATTEIERLTAAQENDRQGAQARLQNNMRLRDLREDLAQIVTEQEAAGNAANELRQILSGLGETVVKTTDSTTDLNNTTSDTAAAASGASKEVTSLADAYDSLLDRITPNRREARQYARDLGVLNLALASGRMTTTQYMQAMGMLQESFQAAQRETESLSDTVSVEADAMGRSMQRFEDSIDSAFVDAFRGAFDSFKSFSDRLIDGFKNLLAELAYQALLKPIVVQFTQSMGGMLGIPGAGGQQGGGFDLSPGGISNAWNMLQNGFGGNSIGQGISSAATSAYGSLTGNAVSYGGSGWASSATAGNASWLGNASNVSNLANIGGALGGNYISGELFGESQEQQIGSTLGAIAGNFIPVPYIGPLIGSTIGGWLGSLVGSSPTKFSGRFGTTDTTDSQEHFGYDGREVFEHQDTGRFYQESALGNVGFMNVGTERLQRAGIGEGKQWAEDLVNATAQIDNLVGAMAQGEPELNAMREAVQALEVSSGNAADIIEFALNERPRAAIDAMTSDFGVFVQSLEGGIEEVIAQAQFGQSSLSLMQASMERLNLQFDDSGSAAYSAASNIASLVGGTQNLSTMLSGYYDAFYTEQEKFDNLASDLTSTFSAMGRELPTTREGVRNLVESLQLMGAAGQEQLATVLQTTPALWQYVQGMQAQREALARAREENRQILLDQYESITGSRPDDDAPALDRYLNYISAGHQTIEQVLEMIVRDVGPAAAVMQRYRDGLMLKDQTGSILNPANPYADALGSFDLGGFSDAESFMQYVANSSAENLYNLADAFGLTADEFVSSFGDLAKGVSQVQVQAAQLETRLFQGLGDTAALREIELAALDPSNRALQERIWTLEDATSSLAAAEQVTSSVESAIDAMLVQYPGADDTRRTDALSLLNSMADSGEIQQGTELDNALNTVSQIDSSKYGSFADYSREFARTTATLGRVRDVAKEREDREKELIKQIKQQSEEIKALREDMRASQTAIASQTQKTAKILERFEIDGIEVRS